MTPLPISLATAPPPPLPLTWLNPAREFAAAHPELLVIAALVVTVIVAVAEWQHSRRVARISRLAFGATGRPAAWTTLVPGLRIVAAGALTWGLLFLGAYDPVEIDRHPAKNASKQVLLCFDASPSMHVADAGPEKEKVTRAVWGGKVVQAILDRLDMETTRVTIVGFYTDALPIVKETFDKDVVRNVLDGLPMYAAFEPGGTDVSKGLAEAFELAKPWPKSSALLVVVTDGDTAGNPNPGRMPSSIADAIVIGVGDSNRATPLWGRPSRQDSGSLRQLAARLGGLYHDGNIKHLPSSVLEGLALIQPRVGADVALRDLALFAAGFGGFTLALASPALLLLGRRRADVRSRRRTRPMNGSTALLHPPTFVPDGASSAKRRPTRPTATATSPLPEPTA